LKNIFLSYSQKTERELADALHSALEAAGHQVFLDRRSIRAGEHWQERLRTEIQSADAMVVLLSKVSVQQSDYVPVEVEYARRRRQKGEPLQLFGVRVDFSGELGLDFEAAFRRTQLVTYQGDVGALIEELLRGLDCEEAIDHATAYRAWAEARPLDIRLVGLGSGARLPLDQVFVPLRLSQRELGFEPRPEDGLSRGMWARRHSQEELGDDRIYSCYSMASTRSPKKLAGRR